MSEIRTVKLGPGPANEKLAAPDEQGYYARNNRDMKRWQNTLVQLFGAPPDGAFFATLNEETDFGPVRELAIKYHADNLRAAEYAHRIERDMPAHWIGDVQR